MRTRCLTRQLIAGAPELEKSRLDQIAALPLGGRLYLDPWNVRLTLQRAPSVPLVSAREKMSLMLTALVPFVKYFDAGVASGAK